MKRALLLAPFVLLMAVPSATSASGPAPAARLYNLSVSSGLPFAGDRRLLATVTPNGDGLRDQAVVRFRLDRAATVAMHVLVTGKHPREVRTIKRSFGAGWQAIAWAPRTSLLPRTYLLYLTVRSPDGAKRVYGSLVHSLERKHPAPVVRVRGIDAAFGRRSYAPDAVAWLRVAADVPSFTLQLFQAGPETQPTVGYTMEGVPMDEPRQVDWSAHRDAPTSVIVHLGDWPNGIYLAKLTAPNGRSYDAPFVLRPHQYGLHRVAVILHTNTWQAYNHQDGDGDGWGDTWYAAGDIRTVDLSRPYINGGAPPKWRMYDLPFIHWLYRTGKQVDFLSDDDLQRFHNGRTLGRLYDLIVFPGHEEYATRHEYNLVLGYRNRGGNLIFLSATNFMWRADRRGDRIRRITRWRDLGRPESQLVGVQYRGNDEGQHHGAYVLSPFGRGFWALDDVDQQELRSWRWFGIEYDMTTRFSPRGIHVLGRVNPHMRTRRLRGEMTYYQRGGAKVFAAGTLNFPAGLVYPPFRALLENVWQRLVEP